MNITSAKYCPKTKFESESSYINATIDGKENIVYAEKGKILSINNQYNFRLTNGFKISNDNNEQIEKLEFLNYILNIDHKNISNNEVIDKNTFTIFDDYIIKYLDR